MSSHSNNVPALNFIGTMLANLDNEKMSDKDFRDFIRNTMPIVEKPELESIVNQEVKQNIAKYYNIQHDFKYRGVEDNYDCKGSQHML